MTLLAQKKKFIIKDVYLFTFKANGARFFLLFVYQLVLPCFVFREICFTRGENHWGGLSFTVWSPEIFTCFKTAITNHVSFDRFGIGSPKKQIIWKRSRSIKSVGYRWCLQTNNISQKACGGECCWSHTSTSSWRPKLLKRFWTLRT